MYIPIPEGLQVPEGDMFDLVTTYRIEDGQLAPLAIDGIPLAEMEEPEMEESGGQEMPEGEDGGGFQAAIEKAMAKGK